MVSITEQLEMEKQTKKEKLKDLFYVDYCNNCKNEDIRGEYGKDYTPCHHPWYCWNDNGEVQKLEYELGVINHNIWLRGYACAYEVEQLKELRKRKWELIKQGRRNMPRIKHKR